MLSRSLRSQPDTIIWLALAVVGGLVLTGLWVRGGLAQDSTSAFSDNGLIVRGRDRLAVCVYLSPTSQLEKQSLELRLQTALTRTKNSEHWTQLKLGTAEPSLTFSCLNPPIWTKPEHQGLTAHARSGIRNIVEAAGPHRIVLAIMPEAELLGIFGSRSHIYSRVGPEEEICKPESPHTADCRLATTGVYLSDEEGLDLGSLEYAILRGLHVVYPKWEELNLGSAAAVKWPVPSPSPSPVMAPPVLTPPITPIPVTPPQLTPTDNETTPVATYEPVTSGILQATPIGQ